MPDGPFFSCLWDLSLFSRALSCFFFSPLACSLTRQLLGWAVEASVLDTKARGFDSVLEGALSPAGIPTTVYTSLLSTVQAALPRTLHKYMALRGRLLGARSSAGGAFQLRPWDVRARGEPRLLVHSAVARCGRSRDEGGCEPV